MSKPEITPGGTGLTFTWKGLGVQILLARLRDGSRGCEAEWTIKRLNGETPPTLITTLKSSLSSGSARDQLVKRLNTLWERSDWVTLIETVCVRTMQDLRKGDPAQALTGEEVPYAGESFILNPLLYARHPTILYGPGDSGKSLFALFAGLLLSVGGSQAGLACAPQEVLYLDWELQFEDMQGRLALLKAGHPELKAGRLTYRRMRHPLADNLDEVRAIMQATDASVLIIDSLALAAGGELERSETAFRFFHALGLLERPALIIGHTAKNAEEKTVFGSVFFFNHARAVWEAKKVQEADSPTSTLALYHRKCNLGPRQRPLGFSLTVTNQSARIDTADLSEDPELSHGLPLSEQIGRLLSDHIGRTGKEIADALQQKPVSIRGTLARWKGKKWYKTGEGVKEVWFCL